jgi:hypothetical protein
MYCKSSTGKYKYVLFNDYVIQSGIKPKKEIVTPYINLTIDVFQNVLQSKHKTLINNALQSPVQTAKSTQQ